MSARVHFDVSVHDRRNEEPVCGTLAGLFRGDADEPSTRSPSEVTCPRCRRYIRVVMEAFGSTVTWDRSVDVVQVVPQLAPDNGGEW